jgi:uncharacterized membrane protein
MQTILAFFLCVGAGTVGGIFFAFSTFVMQALAQLPNNQGAAAMQRINVAVLNPLFLGVFMGTALLSAACLIAAFVPLTALRSALLVAASILYLVGCFFVTIRRNVPMNERLARLDSESSQSAEYWPAYARAWSMWNHVRTTASLASAACSAAALAV